MSMIVTYLYCHPHHYSSFVQLQLGDILGEPSSAALAPCIRGCRGSLEPFSGENIQVSGSPQARVLRSQVLLKRVQNLSPVQIQGNPHMFSGEKTSTKLHSSV